ncbi:pyridoxamine 5'-phosphate oxidase family protein [Nocardioides agariphilus]|jgi:hypothetical protein|uniref:Pyridoxamine 5'-phosphate oxidase family protein n=1 Tax=Nocardioides agariphilus TaxID=433664 RepID=A0A930YHM5_9ACTN|nr:pyridoxamine 5'-phosphate oxidase family protein [Nocardioides agariphilus]MBF4767158.1 pyridoxamine 5'-phosphate oxidase family protein [Nocardioides agariphilus]
MNNDDRWFQGHLKDLDPAECWELLAASEVGRIAYVDDHGPLALPVTFRASDGSVLFRVSAYSQLARHLPGADAALEVDDFDYFTRTGWSVLLRGRVESVDSDALPPEQDRPTPWPEGLRSLYLRLVVDTVSGRRLLEA